MLRVAIFLLPNQKLGFLLHSEPRSSISYLFIASRCSNLFVCTVYHCYKLHRGFFFMMLVTPPTATQLDHYPRRKDRLYEEPTAKNSQGLFLPAACLFVGK